MAPACITQYRARNPRATPLYRLFETQFEEVRGQWEDRFERRFGFLAEVCPESESKGFRGPLPGEMPNVVRGWGAEEEAEVSNGGS